MKIIECAQGTQEWLESRSGIITASMFSECCRKLKVGKNKGGPTTLAEDYAFKLAVERISGSRLEEDKFETFEMRRGHDLEPDARLLHESEKGILVDPAGIIVSDDGRFGASVDGLINNDGISEYKCFISPKRLKPILMDGDIDEIKHQAQGGLWLTERDYCDCVLYCPALEPVNKELTIITTYRDDEYIKNMERDLLIFDDLVCSYMEKLKQAA